jgi:molybdopterin adenylyltransferase
MTLHDDQSSAVEHREQAPEGVTFAVLTVSDTRTDATDTGGALIREMLEHGGHRVSDAAIVADELADIADRVSTWCGVADVDAVIVTGGTGIAERDRTPEALRGIFERELPGFGEIFRMLSYQQIGAAAMLSRATAGICRGTVIFALPGSRNAIRLALEQLVLPETAHIVFELRKLAKTGGASNEG